MTFLITSFRSFESTNSQFTTFKYANLFFLSIKMYWTDSSKPFRTSSRFITHFFITYLTFITYIIYMYIY